jgi:glycosyltransferase involved in cell wall biosynthesis
VQALIGSATALIVPSEWYENASMVVLEAMAQATPVICSNMGGLPEQVTDGISGLIFPAGNAQALHDCIQRLTEDAALAQQLGHAAQERVQSHFSLDCHGELLLETYRKAMEKTLAKRDHTY